MAGGPSTGTPRLSNKLIHHSEGPRCPAWLMAEVEPSSGGTAADASQLSVAKSPPAAAASVMGLLRSWMGCTPLMRT